MTKAEEYAVEYFTAITSFMVDPYYASKAPEFRRNAVENGALETSKGRSYIKHGDEFFEANRDQFIDEIRRISSWNREEEEYLRKEILGGK